MKITTKLNPDVYLRAAEGLYLGEYAPMGACCAVSEARYDLGEHGTAYAEFFEQHFKPKLDPRGYRPAYWLEYGRKRNSICGVVHWWLRIPDELVLERRVLALLLCAELAKDHNKALKVTK